MRIYLTIAIITLTLVSCGFWTNFTTYFNTYYNAERLITESEKEFAYQDEKSRAVKPRTHIPDYNLLVEDVDNKSDVPAFMTEFIISKAKLQPVRVKLDSVLIKGSKILANKSESDFIEGTLYLMAQAYFYRSEWLPCEVKCGELIDIYPDGEKSPDAHLLLAKSLLIQKKFDYGKKVLSRTVDVCWQLERYDILSEAFRLQADLAIYEDDLEEALRPYKQAIAQSNDSRLKAKWQLDMAVLLYKLRQFDRAEVAFDEVYDLYNPEYVQLFEAKLYRAISLAKLGRYEESDDLITELEEDGKWEEWQDYSKIGRLFLLKEKSNDTTDTTVSPRLLDSAENFADTSFVGQTLLMAYQYDKGAEEFYEGDYSRAKYFMDKARRRRTDIFDEATKINRYLGDLLTAQSKVSYYVGKPVNYDNRSTEQYDFAAQNAFLMGRTYEKFGMEDSIKFYYKEAYRLSSYHDPNRQKYIWAYANKIREEDQLLSDSLLQVIVDKYPHTEYSAASQKILGFTEYYVIDSAKEVYSSGVEHRKFGNLNFAVKKFLECANEFPTSSYAPKALYHAGWIFENKQRRPDSAMKYYRILVNKYPNSEYAKDIVMSLAYLESILLGSEVPDSLNAEKMKKTILSTMTPEEIEKKYPGIKASDLNNVKQEDKGFFERATDFLKKQIGSTIDSSLNQINDKIEDLDSVRTMDPSQLKDFKLNGFNSDSIPGSSEIQVDTSPTPLDSANNNQKK